MASVYDPWMANGLNQFERVVVGPVVCHGKPVIRGTRVLVQVILGCLAGGDSVEEAARAFGIAPDDARAAVVFAEHARPRVSSSPFVALEQRKVFCERNAPPAWRSDGEGKRVYTPFLPGVARGRRSDS